MKKTASIKVKIPTESENYLRLTAPSCKEVHRCVRQAGITRPSTCPLAWPLTGPLTGRQTGIDTNYFQVTD